MGEVTPKLPSELALFQTLCESNRFGNSPLSLAIPQGTVTSVVVPGVVVGTVTSVTPVRPSGACQRQSLADGDGGSPADIDAAAEH